MLSSYGPFWYKFPRQFLSYQMDFLKYYFESLIVHNDCTPFCIHKGTLISIERWILIGDGIPTSFIWVVKYSKAKFPVGFMGSKIVDWKLGLGQKFVGWKFFNFLNVFSHFWELKFKNIWIISWGIKPFVIWMIMLFLE